MFDRAEAVERSSAPTQRMAIDGLADVPIIDMADYICSGSQCPPVIGNVLIYRQGSHLTDTYVRSLAPRLDEALEHVWIDQDHR